MVMIFPNSHVMYDHKNLLICKAKVMGFLIKYLIVYFMSSTLK